MNLLFIKLALRNIFRNKFYSLINIVGFTIGIATTLFILLFIDYETGFDSFHEDIDNIYRVTGGYSMKGQETNMGLVWYPVAPDLMAEMPEIENFCRVSQSQKTMMFFNGQVKKVEIARFADPNIFDFFNYKLLFGNPETALDAPDKLVVSKDEARRIFGDINPLGQSLIFNKKTFTVSGVFDNFPLNSHLQADVLISTKYIEQEKETYWLGWAGGLTFLSYLQLGEQASVASLEEKVDDFLYPRFNKEGEKKGFELFLAFQKIDEIHLNSSHLQYDINGNRNKTSIYIISTICLLILVLAVINYISFYVAQKATKVRDIGILKIHGAEKLKLAFQTFIEVVLVSLIASLLSLFTLKLFLPFLNTYLETAVSISDNLIKTVIFLVVIVLCLSVLITAISNVSIVKLGSIGLLSHSFSEKNNNHLPQNIMMAFQFSVVVMLVVAGLIITRQNSFLLNQELGFTKENILSMSTDFEFTKNELNTLKNELERLPETQVVSLSSQSIGNGLTQNGYYFEPNGDVQMINALYADADFLECFDVELTSGHNFSANPQLNKNSVLINQKLVDLAGWEEPLRQKIFRNGALEVVGTINDFNFASLYTEIKPLLVMSNSAHDGWNYQNVNIRYQTADIQALVKKVGNMWKHRFPDVPYEISFLDQQLESNYKVLKTQQKIVVLFTSLAIFIASMGLFGFTLLSTRQRIKEIGIRKVNGAKVSEILSMLNRDFIKWVAIAFVMACPIAWYAMNKWLENFAYKTSLRWWIFALAGVLAMVIALLTVSWQSWRAATRNPVEALRYE